MKANLLRLLAFAAVLTAAGAFAQGVAQTAAVACPKAAEITHRDLLGTWKAEVEGQPGGATLVLRQHPELADSVRGVVRRGGSETEAAGDVDEGEFTLEESANGTNISAAWLGEIAEGSCGRVIRGSWQADGEHDGHKFVLRKQ